MCLLHLRVGSQHSGMYGRTILEFETYWPGKELPSNKISAGKMIAFPQFYQFFFSYLVILSVFFLMEVHIIFFSFNLGNN